ncbi:glucose-6-phosphate dehydrogenase [Kaistia dalseonensis]|uniref:Glucose-6-phosphate 1-dehydrogenase n=1 Tax=Kaistia dalseonensis TaxID=410840 RepID=A0ABU0HAX9_9HYPH|nr:glucose-6-phosphate dehydrogenase [Kaistia dalseonensis]MCX5496799.1 glucose-6-phosphate dehydrogenase [Kaistia dalseonensis]MDQ0439425.1 glucose-6-phosphate 1-dehydrogenase [Kaistia dalseonensis]
MSVFPGKSTLPKDATPAPPSTLFIFGGSGDLTKRLVMPALYNLARDHALDPDFRIVGIDLVEHDDANYRTYLTETVRGLVSAVGGALDEDVWDWMMQRTSYIVGNFDDASTYEKIGAAIAGADKDNVAKGAVFYLAVAPRFFGSIAEKLSAAGLMSETDGAFRRIVVEKPFGMDLPSARALNARLLAAAAEHQIFRIDHFLGKETVQNVMALRFGNGIFEPVWNRNFIDHVQITAAETVTVEKRGHFYDATGALRDMVPNHMFQLLAMIAMEPPNSFDADAIRTEKAKVIQAIRPLSRAEAAASSVRAQYVAGTIAGEPIQDYREEADVARDSTTETYVALRLQVENWRWSGVPFYIRTGKAMTVRRTEIAVQFKSAPHTLFQDTPTGKLLPNVLVIRVQPDEGISLRLAAKVPGRNVRLAEVDMDFHYADYFKTEPSTGYETLIYDCLTGDATLFQRADNIEAGWAAVEPILDLWASTPARVDYYRAGSSGPNAADDLIERDGFKWLPLDEPRPK